MSAYRAVHAADVGTDYCPTHHHRDRNGDTKSYGERRCTDPACLTLFILFLAYLAMSLNVARRDGDLAKLTHGFDWQGRICGVDSEVKESPLLYWCGGTAEDTGHLMGGICVRRCPNDSDVSSGARNWCPGSARSFQQELTAGNQSREVVVGTKRNLTLKPVRASVEALGYCFPSTDAALLRGVIEQTHLATGTKQIFLAAHGALNSWRFLICVGFVCVCVGYLFLFILWLCFEPLIYSLLTLAHILLLVAASALIYVGFEPNRNFFHNYLSRDSSKLSAWCSAAAIIMVWLLYTIILCRGREGLTHAISTVRSSCNVVGHLPSLLLQPLLHSLAIVILLLVLLYGLAWILSLGKVIPYLDAPLELAGDAVVVVGVRRSFEFTNLQWCYITSWVFGVVWILESANALGQFAISHVIVGHVCLGLDAAADPRPVLRGYLTGLFYHLGTLTFAGFVIGCLKIVSVVLWMLTRQTGSDHQDRRAAVSAVCCCCCSYCVACMEHLMTMVNDLVYTDVALQGSDYLEAAENVVQVAVNNPTAYASAKGLATIIRIIGVSSIGGGGAFLSYQALAASSEHRSLRHVFEGAREGLAASSILGVAVASTITCFYIGLAFMVVFYQTMDALLYCKLSGAAGDQQGSARGPGFKRTSKLSGRKAGEWE